MNIVEEIRRRAASCRNHVAVAEGGSELSYGKLLEHVAVLRRGLESVGIGPGMRVAFRCSDGADYIAASLALLDAGAAIVPVDTSLPALDADRLLDRIDVEALLYRTGSLPTEADDLVIAAPVPGFMLRRRRGARALPDIIQDLNPAFIRFSSGTTGASKGVLLSHETIIDRTAAADEALNVDTNDRILWVLSMSHHFVVSILLFLRKGATIVVAHRNFPASVLETAMQGRMTLIYGSPLHYHLLACDRTVPPGALGNVRLAISTAMKLPAETAEAFESKFGFFPGEAYGIIEVGLPFIDLTPSRESLGSVGKILPAYDMCIDKPDAAGLGEILVRGRGLFDAYVSPPSLRDEVLKDGWFSTGDLGYVDSGGNLRIAGRSKSVIICAGMKVFPEEVEEVLNDHEYVSESLVYGADHPVYGQIPEAKIVPAVNTVDGKEMLEGLRRHCYARLPSFSVPKKFEVVSGLTKTASGKIRRR